MPGKVLNGAFAILLPVEPEDTLKELFYRMLGVGFIAVSARPEVDHESTPYAEIQDP
jgi:hypothetical protein